MERLANLKVMLAQGCQDCERLAALIRPLVASAALLQVVDGDDDAVRAAADQQPDIAVILTDTARNGANLAQRLMQHTPPPRIVLAGGANDIDSWRLALEAGAVAYLPHDTVDGIEAALKLAILAVERGNSCREAARRATLLDTLLAELPLGVALVDNAGTILLVNEPLSTLIGRSTADLTHTPLSDLLATLTDTTAPVAAGLLQAAWSGQSWRGELHCCGKNRDERLLDLCCIPIRRDTQHGGMLLTVNDVSSLHAERSRELIQRNAAIDLLLAAMIEGAPSREQVTDLILGQASPAVEPFSLRDLLSSIPSCALPDYIPDRLMGPAGALKLTLQALVSWASGKSSATEAGIGARIRRHEHGSWQLQFIVYMADPQVSGNRYETPADILSTAGSSYSREHAGLGLADLLVSRMGGTLLIRTEDGIGRHCSFSLWMKELSDVTAVTAKPALADESIHSWQQSEATPVQLNAGAGLKILMAEDNPLDQLSLRTLLQQCGHQVVTVGNGLAAVEESDGCHFDLILMDILMPEMDGFEATRLIREREQLTGGQTPIIALTSYSLKAVREKCEQMGMNGYLSKPVSMKNLVNLLGTILGHNHAAPATVQVQVGAMQPDALAVLNLESSQAQLEYDGSLYREVVALFEVHARPTFEELLSNLLKRDVEQAGKVAHKLKGMAANIGADQFREACRVIMEEAHDGHLVDISGWLVRLPGMFEQLEQTIKHLDWDSILAWKRP